MNVQAILSVLFPCLCKAVTEPGPQPEPETTTEDVVWNCDPTAPNTQPEPTQLEQEQEKEKVQIAALPPRPPKTFKNVVDHMVKVRDRLIKDLIDYTDTPAQLWISYQGAVNTLHWIFCAESDKTWDETIDGPAYNAIIEPLDANYYEQRVYPAWRWREVKLKPSSIDNV